MLNVLFYVYEGQNCLHLASFHGFLSLVENMVDLGADIDAKVSKVPQFKILTGPMQKTSWFCMLHLCSDESLMYRSSTTVAVHYIWLWTNGISLWSNSCWRKVQTPTSWPLEATLPSTSPRVRKTATSGKNCTQWPIRTWGSLLTASRTSVRKRTTTSWTWWVEVTFELAWMEL